MENIGLTHKDRHLKELKEGYFHVDERTTNDFIEFSSKFAEYINFYNLRNNLDGNASTFFSKDTTILLILISSFRIRLVEKQS